MMTKFWIIGISLLLSFIVFSEERQNTYGPTTATETIWSIAQKIHPDPALAVNQTIYALYEANPRAFLGKNINHLMKGVILKLPSGNTIRNVDRKRAWLLIGEHQRAWEAKQKSKLAPPPTMHTETLFPTPHSALPTSDLLPQQVEALGKQIENLQNTVTQTQETLSSFQSASVPRPSLPYFLGFKPFEWLLIAFLTLLTACIGWVCFSLNSLRRAKQKGAYSAPCFSEEDPPFENQRVPPQKFQEEVPSSLKQLDVLDETSTKLDLARAYLEMKEHEHAKQILQSVLKQGNAKEREEAHKLLANIPTVPV
ncbi:MAG: hypothetical protein HY559_06585 [Gammaproteobacteria bacterium]|nr:hypothetical protein [Gammaproteobacteria bacterium]